MITKQGGAGRGRWPPEGLAAGLAAGRGLAAEGLAAGGLAAGLAAGEGGR